MYTEKLETWNLPTEIQNLIPEGTEYIYVDFEYEPAEEGNRAGHPDTWTPDQYESWTVYDIYDAEGDNYKISKQVEDKIGELAVEQMKEKASEY